MESKDEAGGWLRLVRDPKWRGLSVILIGTFLSVIVHNIATVTLPSIAADFGSTLAEVQWVAIAVSLTTAAVVMPAGYLADRLGRRAFSSAAWRCSPPHRSWPGGRRRSNCWSPRDCCRA